MKPDNIQNVTIINDFIRSQPWLDVDLYTYDSTDLILIGGIDLTAYHQIEIKFRSVHCYHGVFHWHTDTSRPFFDIPKGSELIDLNGKYSIERGHDLFRIFPEDHNGPIIIAAENCIPSIKTVYYK